MMVDTEQQREVLQREASEVWNEGDLDLIDEFYTEDYVGHSTTNDIEGPVGRKQYIGMFRAAFSDGEIAIEDLVMGEDKVATRYSWNGTHDGELMGVPATGNRVNVESIVISRFENERIAEQWIVGDIYGLMQQLGVVG